MTKIITLRLLVIFGSLASVSCHHVSKASYSLEEALNHPEYASNVIIEDDSDLEFLSQLDQLPNLTRFEVTNRNLRVLPKEAKFNKGIVFLTIKADSLAFPDQICDIDSLFELTATCKVSRIPEGITRLKKLRTVNLFDCQLRFFPAKLLEIPEIRTIDLSRNKIEELPADLKYPATLGSLTLNNNPIKDLPVSVFNADIAWLRFAGLGIKSLPSGITFNGTSLDLMSNGLSDLPNDMEAPHMVELFLGGNNFTQFPKVVTRFTALRRVLEISSNSIPRLPPEISNLKNLEMIVASHNWLARLPPEIGELTNLRELRLNNNPLSELPPELEKLTNITLITMMETTLPIEQQRKWSNVPHLKDKFVWNY